TVVSGKTTVRSATSAATFKVVKATTSKVTVTGKKFTKGTKPTVSVEVATLSNGQVATGKVRVYVGGKLVKTVTLSAKNKGKVSVTLPKKYSKTITVKAKYLPKSTTTVTGKTSTTIKVTTKK
ncbi:MAG TPA: hypothetical protein VNR62_04675, partial [Cellulomonas sp.]|nr:hypothetical protein [Cellulomonas sp.]